MIAEVAASWERIKKERETMMSNFRKEFAREPNNDKLDRVLDTMVGKAKGGRGRPPGSKNKHKLVNPNLIGTLPNNDLIILKRG